MRTDDPDSDDDGEEMPEIVAIPLEEQIDLHGYRPSDVAEIVRDYLDDAWAAGFNEVRLVHGRGIGALRELVRTLLSRDGRVESFGDAPAERGGQGATLARFRR